MLNFFTWRSSVRRTEALEEELEEANVGSVWLGGDDLGRATEVAVAGASDLMYSARHRGPAVQEEGSI